MSHNSSHLMRAAALVGLLLSISLAQAAGWTAPPTAAMQLEALPGTGFTTTWTDGELLEFSGQDGPEDSGENGYRWKAAPAESPDRKGLARDTGYFLVYQMAVIGLLYVMPESVSSWSEEDKDEYSLEVWQDNVRDPGRDSDTNFINYVMHPYWGATYYVRGQQRGLSRSGSFWYSTLLSTLYEFGPEALFEIPSYQDLWATPVLGSLMGEFWFMPVRERIRAKSGPLGWKDKMLLLLTDPLGVVSEETDRLLGIQTELRLVTFDTRQTANVRATNSGTSYAYPLADSALGALRPAMGLQLRMYW